MQNYRNNTNDYMRRGNYGRSCRNTNYSNSPVSTPYPLSGRNEQTSDGHFSRSYSENSACCERDDVLEGMPLAMAYVPWQNWKRIYDVDKALCRGTIFEELDKPFYGMGGCNQ